MSDINTLTAGLNLTTAQITQLETNLNTLKSAKLLELDTDVARAEAGSRLTRAGLDLLAKAVAGKELRYTRVKFGDSIKNGKVIEPSDEQMVEYTSLIHAREIELPIADVRFSGGGTATVKFVVDNTNVEEGFWAREVGLFATDPDTNQEILYCYRNTGVLSTYIPAGGHAVAMTLVINLITVIDQATNVTAIVDASLLHVTQAEFIDHINDVNPHPNIPHKAKALTTTDAIWVTGTDQQLHTITTENLTIQMLGGNLYELPHLSSRIAQTEINVANLFMQVNAKEELNLDANLLLAEDFEDNRFCDFFKVKVNDEVGGVNNVCVADARGVLEGHYYTISDGVRSQAVRVQSVAKNDNLYVIIFEQDLNYTFNLKKTYLYRSTGLVTDKKLSGAGDLRSSLFKFTDVWKGESSSQTQSLKLATTLSNKKNFTLSGDWAFDGDGFFTIS